MAQTFPIDSEILTLSVSPPRLANPLKENVKSVGVLQFIPMSRHILQLLLFVPPELLFAENENENTTKAEALHQRQKVCIGLCSSEGCR